MADAIGREALEDIREILAASDPVRLFGTNGKRARIRYRRLVRSVHPDANHDAPEAQEAMRRLNALWEAYKAMDPTTGAPDPDMAGHKHSAGERFVHEIARTDRFALFSEGDAWLVVDRVAGNPTPPCDPKGLETLRDILAGSPVHALRQRGAKAIRQADGDHEAITCDVPAFFDMGQHVFGMRDLKSHVPGGMLEPEDAAWLAKRVLFLVAALDKAGLALDATVDAGDCMMFDTDAHVLMLVAPHRLVGGTADVEGQRRETKPVLDAIRTMTDERDPRGRRLVAFFRGMDVDRVTDTADLFAEFDGLLLDMFGKPRFHRMTVV